MGIVRFDIELDNPTKTYQNGSVVSGVIRLDLDAPKSVKGLKLTVHGEGKIEYPQTRAHGTTKMEERKEVYVDDDEHLLGADGATVITEGEHVYPFSFKLPDTIPPSYKDRFGAIGYEVKVTIQRAWCLWDHKVSTDFLVVVPLDLNNDHKAAEPVRQDVSKTFVGSSNPVYMTVSLPVRGYVPGQAIPVTVDVRNGAKVNIKGVCFTLIKLSSYHGKSRTRRQEVLLTDHETPIHESGDIETRIQHSIEIPQVQPSRLKHSKLIDLEYLVQVEVRVGGLHKNFEVRIPVIIGSVA